MLFSETSEHQDSFVKDRYIDAIPNSSEATLRKLDSSRDNKESFVKEFSVIQSSARSNSSKKFMSKIPGKNLIPVTQRESTEADPPRRESLTDR